MSASVERYPDQAMSLLKAKGYRQTKPRRLVLEALEAATRPLSPYELADAIREGGEKSDVVSIYRIMQTLEEHGLVHRMVGSGKFRKCHLAPEADCTRHQHQHCHHNLVCRACGRIDEVHCPGMDLLEQALSAQSPFLIEGHVLEFTGLCGDCRPA